MKPWGKTPLSEMSKASYGRRQKTDDLTPPLAERGATVQAHLPLTVRPFN